MDFPEQPARALTGGSPAEGVDEETLAYGLVQGALVGCPVPTC